MTCLSSLTLWMLPDYSSCLSPMKLYQSLFIIPITYQPPGPFSLFLFSFPLLAPHGSLSPHNDPILISGHFSMPGDNPSNSLAVSPSSLLFQFDLHLISVTLSSIIPATSPQSQSHEFLSLSSTSFHLFSFSTPTPTIFLFH